MAKADCASIQRSALHRKRRYQYHCYYHRHPVVVVIAIILITTIFVVPVDLKKEQSYLPIISQWTSNHVEYVKRILLTRTIELDC
jgi:hypothetical protein